MSEELEVDESADQRAKDFARIVAMYEYIEYQRDVIATQEDERVTLKARIAELESWYAASQESQRELLKRIALAERLAEAAEDHDCSSHWVFTVDPQGGCDLCESLAAYRSGGDDG